LKVSMRRQMTNKQRQRREREEQWFRDHFLRYWDAEIKRRRQTLDEAEWDGADADKLATLKQSLTNARQKRDKWLTK
jgi:hypothetical protein